MMEDSRLKEIQEFIVSVAMGSDYKYLTPSSKEDAIDVIMIGINMLVDELVMRQKRDMDNAIHDKHTALHLAESRSVLLSNMSHEVRTPLNGIVGMIDLLKKDSELTNKQSEALNVIFKASEQLLAVVNNVLDLAKLEANEQEVQFSSVDINNLLGSLSTLYKEQADKKGLKIELSVPFEFPKLIKIDEIKISQIISNLLLNAVKFSEKGIIKIIVSITKTLEDKIQYKIQIVDSGAGIPEDRVGQIFQKYKQLDNSYANSIKGTGLGLAICKELVTLVGGEIGVESKVGEGSNFWVALESEIAEEEPEIIENVEIKNNLGLSCLLVDDNAINILIGRKMLEVLGCQICVAENGKIAVDMFEEGKFDIILMDVQMPEMDGIITTKTIKEQYKLVPPIIGLTADTIKGAKERYIAQGFDDHLGKPYKLIDLYSTIIKWTK